MARPLQARALASLPTAKLSTGCPQLDAVLGGGLPVGSLTEVAGAPGGDLRHCWCRRRCRRSLPPPPPATHSRLACPSLPAGEAAASKTQLSLQLLLSAQLPQQYGGLDGAAVYVYTEGEPAMRRLHQLARWLHLR